MNKAEWDAMAQWQKEVVVAHVLMGWGKLVDSEYTKEYYDLGNMPRYTIDRNACALVLGEIDTRNLRVEFEDALADESDDPAVFIDARYAIEWAMRLSPDFICYCAVKAVENENT